MRAVAISVLVLGCGTPEAERGRLICKDGDKTFEAYVARGKRADIVASAETAQLTDCRFEPGPPAIDHWPVIAKAPDPVAPIRVPATPGAPINVPPTALENNRLSGVKTVVPDPDTQREIRDSGKAKVIGSYKLCITVDGDVATVSQLKSTGFAAYDGKIIDTMKTWRYVPYIYNGDPAPVCTAVTFIYTLDP